MEFPTFCSANRCPRCFPPGWLRASRSWLHWHLGLGDSVVGPPCALQSAGQGLLSDARSSAPQPSADIQMCLWTWQSHPVRPASVTGWLTHCASCKLVARPGGGFRKPLPVASPSKPSSWGEEGISAIKFLLTLSLPHLRQEESKASAHASPPPTPPPRAHLFLCLALSSACPVFFYIHQHLYYMGFFIQVVQSILGAM